MTDFTKLIDDVMGCSRQIGITEANRAHGNFTQDDSRFLTAMQQSKVKHVAALQSAIEALRAAQASQSMQLAHDAVTIECLNDKVLALQAKLDELQRQEPIGKLYVSQHGDSGIGLEFTIDKPEEVLCVGQAVYAAPKALEPLTRLQINQMMAYAGWQNSAIRHADLDGVEKVVRAVERHHGITKGTP